MGGCTSNSKGRSEEKKNTAGYIVDPGNFVKIRKESIKSHYEIKDQIARGGFGAVYVVRHLKSRSTRAAKFISIRGSKVGEIDNLLREVSLLKKMDHVNIVRVYEVFQDDANLIIITELCKGGELFERIQKQRSFTENLAANYMYEMVSAVTYMHANNIVHRDLKPENLLFESTDSNSHLKLIDFGTCKHFTKNARIYESVGSPYYIAPEVIRGSYNEKCDV